MPGGIGSYYWNQPAFQNFSKTYQGIATPPQMPTYDPRFTNQLFSLFPQLTNFNALPQLPSDISNAIGAQTDARAKALFGQNNVNLAGRGFGSSSEQARTGGEIAANLAQNEADRMLQARNMLGQGNLAGLQAAIGAAGTGGNINAQNFGTQAGLYDTQYKGMLDLFQQFLPMLMQRMGVNGMGGAGSVNSGWLSTPGARDTMNQYSFNPMNLLWMLFGGKPPVMTNAPA